MSTPVEYQARLHRLERLSRELLLEVMELSSLVKAEPSLSVGGHLHPEHSATSELVDTASDFALSLMRTDPLRVRRRRKRQSLATAYPETAALWHPTKNGDVTPENVTKTATQKYWWKCPECESEWLSTVLNQTMRKNPCKSCAQTRIQNRRAQAASARPLRETLNSLFPSISTEWHPELNGDLTPDTVSPKSHERAWWKCSNCGHPFRARIVNRTIGSRCPQCSHLTTG